MIRSLLVLGACCFTFSGAAPYEVDAPASLSLVFAQEGEECDTLCITGECGEGNHQAIGVEEEEANYHENDGHHIACRGGTCANSHGPSCGSGGSFALADFESLTESLAAGDAAGVRAVLAEHSDRVRVNTARAAIQVSDCQGDMFAHLPATPEISHAVGVAE